jgi:4-carboxymuconolactone decarboxylase
MLNINLAKIASCIASKRFDALRQLILNAGTDNKTLKMVYEVMLQSYLFCGFPAALESLKVLHNAVPRFNPSKNTLNLREFKAKGIKNFRVVYGGNADKLLKNVAGLSPDLNEWMVIEGYGKVMGRRGLSLKQRELVTVAFLCTNYYEVQLHSHIRGALNAGAGYKEILEVIKSTSKFNSKVNLSSAVKLASEIAAKV